MGLGVVAIADPPTAIRLKVPFSDGLGGVLRKKSLEEIFVEMLLRKK